MKRMNFCVQCTDVVSGEKGSFGFDTAAYLNADKPLQFKAITPVFSGLPELFNWARQNDVELFFEPVIWRPGGATSCPSRRNYHETK